MQQLFFSVDRESKRLTISRREDGALVFAIHAENNDRIFTVSNGDAEKLANAISNPL